MESGAKIPQGGKQKKEGYGKGAVLLFLIVIFAVIFLAGGVKTYPDTESYLNMAPFREPGYALLLNGMKFCFGGFGFTVLAFLQNALAVFSIYQFSCYIGSKYRGNYVMPVTAVCMVFPYVMTPLFASSGILLTNAMISEGVTLPLYHLFFLFLLKAVWEEEKQWNYFLISLLLSAFLLITRGQMAVTLIAWLIVALVVNFRNKKKILASICLFLLVLVCRTVGTCSYNLLVNGTFAGTTYGPVTILSNVIYVADREDGQAVSKERFRELFYEIYGIAEDGQMLFKNAPSAFSEEAVFYSDMHDDIKDFAIFPVLQDYVQREEGMDDYMEKSVRVDEIAGTMYRELLSESFLRWFSHYIRNAAVGLIRTAAFVHPLFNIPALLGYFVLTGMGIYCYRKKKESRAVKLLLLTALLTAGNVAAVSLTIMCLSRYMIYNTALLYVTAFLLLIEIWIEKWRRK